MGRNRAKGKKATASAYDDLGSGEEEKIPAQKKRGRPLKTPRDEIEEEVVVISEKIEQVEVEDIENGKKKKRASPSQEKEEDELVKEENGTKSRSSTEDSSSIKLNGFRHNGNRRKNKPRRAAEAVVECR